MVASKQVEIPFCRDISRKHGRGFGGLAKHFGRTAIPILRKYIVPAAKRVGTDYFEFAAPDNAEVVSSRKDFKRSAQNVVTQLRGNSWVVVAGKRLQAESFQQNLQNKPVGREGTFLRTLLNNHG